MEGTGCEAIVAVIEHLGTRLATCSSTMVCPVEHSRAAPNEPARVLIVEDERVARQALGSLLSTCGYRVELAASAEEAIELLQRRLPPDVVLLDVDLPGMNGLELLSRLSSLAPDVVPILVTGADRDVVQPAADRGIGYVRKPVDINNLLCLMDRSLGRS